MSFSFDVLIVGAGASGLAAARHLREGGVRTIVLEARNRIGGRVHSVQAPDLELPIELGAEFIHGLAPHTLALAKELKLPVVEVPAAHYVAHGRRLSRWDDYARELVDAMTTLSRRGGDRSVSEQLRRVRSKRRRALVLDYVRGFEAADPDRASAAAMADSAPTGDQRRQLRLVTGYGPLVRGLAKETTIRLGRVVRHIAWQPGRVELHAQHGTRIERYVARAIVLTAPIGVLRAAAGALGHIAIDPPLSAPARAIAQLAMGEVVRVVLRVDGTLGELLGHPDASFVHALDSAFPAWWSPVPMRTPLVVAWVGGPPAAVIDDAAREAIVSQARRALAAMGAVRPKVHAAWLHDWRHDPFARGAYAFPLVGGKAAGARLARPVEHTIFFAGEATSTDYPGTVEGALETGHRAAREVLPALASTTEIR